LEKKAIVEEIGQQIGRSPYMYVANYQGLRVDQLSELRAQLRKSGAELHVVKNRFAKRIADDRKWAELGKTLEGPSAMIVGGDAIESARVLDRFISENKDKPAIKGGVLGDRFISKAQIKELTTLPPREVLLSQVVGTVAAPMSRLVGVVKQKVSTLLYVLKAVEEKKKSA